MRVAVFDTHKFDREFFEEENRASGHKLVFFKPRLSEETASLASGFEAICAFVNDNLSRATLQELKKCGVRLIALRVAGFNNVDLAAAKELGVAVVRVPEYSPHAVAEHAVMLILALNRKIHRAYARVRESNFSLDGLVGFDLHGKTVGIIGTGKIGKVFARIMHGFGCRLLAFDKEMDSALVTELGLKYVESKALFCESDIISLHAPLTPSTKHIINAEAIAQMKRGVMIINTGRGSLIDTGALLQGLKSGQIGFAGLDVYEEEADIFFQDLSGEILQDDVLARLLTFPNVIITSHQGFLTHEALKNIAQTTLGNITAFEKGLELKNLVS
jgi:D-lactate dehydrogenase